MSSDMLPLTLRQEAVWYLWGIHRTRVEDLGPLFGVSTRTVKRDLAAIRARGWVRPRAREDMISLSLNLVAASRAAIEHGVRLAYEQLDSLPPRSRDRPPILNRILDLVRVEARLAHAAAHLAQATVSAQQEVCEKEWELMQAELAAALATLISPR